MSSVSIPETSKETLVLRFGRWSYKWRKITLYLWGEIFKWCGGFYLYLYFLLVLVHVPFSLSSPSPSSVNFHCQTPSCLHKKYHCSPSSSLLHHSMRVTKGRGVRRGSSFQICPLTLIHASTKTRKLFFEPQERKKHKAKIFWDQNWIYFLWIVI